MKKVLVILSVVATTCAFAQKLEFNSFMRSTSQQIMDSALCNVFYIIEAEYAVRDSAGQQYGQNGQSYFAKRQYLALAIQGGKVLPSNALLPWIDDANFSPYASKYTPVLRKLQLHELNDTTHRSITINADDTLSLNGDFVLLKDSADGLVIHPHGGKQDGYLVIVHKSLTGGYQMQLTRQSLDSIGSDEQTIQINSPVTDVLGGVWLTLERSKVGHLQFRLNGIVRSVSSNQAHIVFPFTRLQAISCASGQAQKGLTPIHSNESGKKATDVKKPAEDKKKTNTKNKAKKNKQTTNTK